MSDSTENHPSDKNDRPIMVGDTLKVFHFTAALRRKRHYMYKHVLRVEADRLVLSHLNLEERGSYSISMDGKKLRDYEIVQGYHGGISFEGRDKRATT